MLSMPAAQYIRQGGMTRPRRLDDVMCTGFGASEASAVASEWISCTNSGRHLGSGPIKSLAQTVIG